MTDLSGAARSGSKFGLEDVVEVSYPTEWRRAQRNPGADGKPGPIEFSSPAAFETRNTGSTFEARLDTDQEGVMLRYSVQRVIAGDRSVHHRIHRDGKWQEDVSFPRLSVNEWASTLRISRGQWTLVGSGTDFDAKGHLDKARSVLAFIKVE
ncbi:hypothetical protein [Luteolibacter sp. Populi]|uniref:hypothetical protein n=1 Tax=Luteolibacter sp. Populi TaxID=3230487 RepID=UPI0034662D42